MGSTGATGERGLNGSIGVVGDKGARGATGQIGDKGTVCLCALFTFK